MAELIKAIYNLVIAIFKGNMEEGSESANLFDEIKTILDDLFAKM